MDADERQQRIMEYLLRAKDNINPDNIYKPRDDDIIIVGPPKSGTTWVQQIVHQVRTKGDESFNDIYDVTWWIQNPKYGLPFNINAEQPYKPRVYKHHESYGVIETTERQKNIVIIRDPYDAIYSWSRFIKGYYGGEQEMSDETLAQMIKDLHDANTETNFKSISTWWPHKNDVNVLFLFYEDLKRDLNAIIKQISEFIEIPISADELHTIAGFCSFEYMSRHKDKFKGDLTIEMLAKGIGSDKWSPVIGMVRPDGGQVGQGAKFLGPKLREMVEQLWKETVTDQLGFSTYNDMYRAHSNFAGFS